jgi:hypothetical protein
MMKKAVSSSWVIILPGGHGEEKERRWLARVLSLSASVKNYTRNCLKVKREQKKPCR